MVLFRLPRLLVAGVVFIAMAFSLKSSLSFLLPVFTVPTRLAASFVVILVYWIPSCLFPCLLAFTGLYFSFLTICRSSLFLCSRVGDRHEIL